MEDRWQLERTNRSSEGFVFSVEGKTQEGITAGYKMGAINTCSVSSFALRPASRDPHGAPTAGADTGPFAMQECGFFLLR